MIKNVEVIGLKSIDQLSIDMKKLNILVGTNSSGKSTIVQSILLLSQNIFKNPSQSSQLNGALTSVGDFREARNINTNAQQISICIEDESGKSEIIFEEESTQQKIQENNQLTFDKGLYYLSAARIGSRDTFEKNIRKTYKFGLNGEYCFDYFLTNRATIISKELIADTSSETFEHQVNHWFHKIIGGKIEIENIKNTDQLKVLFKGKNNTSVRTKNIGAGLSYLVTIIIVCLAINPTETIIIENPEIHLHPKAQAILTEFLVFIANANRQVIVETHSDHIFNGIRTALAQKKLNQEDATINFLTLNDACCTENAVIEIAERGKILNAPDDLFDQFEIDLDRMLGL